MGPGVVLVSRLAGLRAVGRGTLAASIRFRRNRDHSSFSLGLGGGPCWAVRLIAFLICKTINKSLNNS